MDARRKSRKLPKWLAMVEKWDFRFQIAAIIGLFLAGLIAILLERQSSHGVGQHLAT